MVSLLFRQYFRLAHVKKSITLRNMINSCFTRISKVLFEFIFPFAYQTLYIYTPVFNKLVFKGLYKNIYDEFNENGKISEYKLNVSDEIVMTK